MTFKKCPYPIPGKSQTSCLQLQPRLSTGYYDIMNKLHT